MIVLDGAKEGDDLPLLLARAGLGLLLQQVQRLSVFLNMLQFGKSYYDIELTGLERHVLEGLVPLVSGHDGLVLLINACRRVSLL